MTKCRDVLAFFCCFSFCLASPLYAEDTASQPTTSSPESQNASASDGSWWQLTHQKVSETVSSWSQNIDDFLSGKRGKGYNGSYVSMRFGPIFESKGNSGFFDFNARLKLPNTKNRLRLVIESSGDTLTKDNQTGESSQDRNIISSALNSNVSAALRYIKDSWGANFDAGILLKFPLDPFLRTRFAQGQTLTQWNWYQREEAFAYYTEGTGLRYQLGFSHQLGDRFEYGSQFGATWFAQDRERYYREDIFLNQSLSEKDKLTYQVSFLQANGGNTDGDSYLYFIDYRHFLHSNWLIGHIKPQMTYKESEGYRRDTSLTLSLEILFGSPYLTH